MIMVLLPLQMLSGGMTPRESMPEWVQQIMLAAPTTHFVMLAQGILFRGGGPGGRLAAVPRPRRDRHGPLRRRPRPLPQDHRVDVICGQSAPVREARLTTEKKEPEMATKQKTAPAAPAGSDGLAKLRRQYGCGPVQFSGTDEALYERHLLFDDVVSPAAAGPRERFEALARSVRDVLVAALGADRGDLRAREPQARLLPVDGVPPRPLAGQQRHEPPARFRRRAGRQGQAPRLARPARTGARRGPGQRRARTPGGVLPRLDGHDATAGHGLRAALRVRHLPPVDPRRLAAGTAGQLAAAPRPVGGRPAQRAGRGQAERLVRGVAAGPCGPSPASRPACSASRTTAPSSATAARRSTRSGSGPRRRRTTSIFRSSARAISSAPWPRRSRPSRSRGSSTRTTPPARGRGCASSRSTSWSPARWPTSCGASGAATPTGTRCRRRSPSSSTTRTPRWPSPS